MTRTIRLSLWCFLAFTTLLIVSCTPETDEAAQHDDHPAGEAEHSDAEEHDDRDEHDEHDENEGVVELGPEAIERIGLRVEAVGMHGFVGRRTTTGTLGFDEERLAHIAPRITGRLVRVPGSLGATVARGETLAILDSTELGQAHAALLRARAHHEAAQRRFEREQALFDDQIASEQGVLEAEATALEAAADLALAREQLRLFGLSRRAVEGLSWGDPGSSVVSVRAPFAGRIVSREATVGELVSPQDTLFTLADLAEVWLWIDLYERDLPHVTRGASVEVRLDAWPSEVFVGELAYVADEVDAGSRTVRARVDLPNPDRRLKPGMFARVGLASGGEPTPVLAVPRTALQRDGERSIVFVRTGPGRFERRNVEIGRTGVEFVEILRGLTEGEEVVTDGAFLLRSQASSEELGGHHH